MDIRIDDQTDRPFVTSVVPVVGENEKATGSRTVGPRQRSSVETAKIPLASKAAPFRLVALDAPNNAVRSDEKPAGGKPFALGQITIGALVSVDYELIK